MALDLSTVAAFFKIADQDRDGVLSGGEAVGFFSRSGLSTECLGQIWELSSGGGAALNTTQFGSALRLVSLAQQNGGQLPLTQARVVLSGLGPALPAPRLTGMQQYGLPSYSPQTTGQGVYSAQNKGYSPQITGNLAPGYSAQATGGSYSAQATGSSIAFAGPVSAAPPSAFPPASPGDMQRYQAMFAQVDTDRDNVVTGGDCFNFFLQWGLDKAVLRDIWAVVAGQSGQLNSVQFTQCLYLMDMAKRGVPVPSQLPPSPFPPVASAAAVPAAPQQQWSLQSQRDAGSQPKVEEAPTVPALPSKIAYNDDSFQAAAAASAVPIVAQATLSSFNNDERAKVVAGSREAEALEVKVQSAESEAAKSKARIEAYTAALSEITMFKSKMDVALINAEDQERRLKNEAESLQKRYDQAYSAAQSQNETSKQVLESIHLLMSQKAEIETKMKQLHVEMSAARTMSPAEVASLEAEVATLTATCVQTEAAHSQVTSQLSGIKKQKEAAEARLAESKAAVASAESELATTRKELEDLQKQVAEARSTGEAGAARDLLVESAKVYRSLLSLCERSGLDVPVPAQMSSNLKIQSWADDVAAGIADWTDDQDADLTGFVVVNALSTCRRLGKSAENKNPASSALDSAALTAAPAAATPAPSASPTVATASEGFGDAAFGGSAFPAATVAPPAAATAAGAPAPGGFQVMFGDD